MTVFIQIPDSQAKKIDNYAKKNDLSLQELFLESVLKRIDSDYGAGNLANMLTKYTENETEYSFDELDSKKK